MEADYGLEPAVTDCKGRCTPALGSRRDTNTRSRQAALEENCRGSVSISSQCLEMSGCLSSLETYLPSFATGSERSAASYLASSCHSAEKPDNSLHFDSLYVALQCRE